MAVNSFISNWDLAGLFYTKQNILLAKFWCGCFADCKLKKLRWMTVMRVSAESILLIYNPRDLKIILFHMNEQLHCVKISTGVRSQTTYTGVFPMVSSLFGLVALMTCLFSFARALQTEASWKRKLLAQWKVLELLEEHYWKQQ